MVPLQNPAPPRFVFLVPTNRVDQRFLEVDRGIPLQLGTGPPKINRVSPVVALSIGHVGDAVI